MSSHEGEPCEHGVTIERVGDLVIADIPSSTGNHYELQLSTTMAIRFASALIRAATNSDHDSLADGLLDTAMTAMEAETEEQAP